MQNLEHKNIDIWYKNVGEEIKIYNAQEIVEILSHRQYLPLDV